MTAPAHRFLTSLYRLRGSDRYAECVRVFLAMAGVVALCLSTGHFDRAIPALLGVIACALADTEDHWRNRISALLITLACFAFTAFAVQWLMPWPLAFAAGLALSTFGLVMLGAVSTRYATIAGSTLLLAVYTMIGADQAGSDDRSWLREPLLLLAGAAWYGLLSLLWSVFSPQRAVRQALARLFDALADYLDGKAVMFLPLHTVDRVQLQTALAMLNERVVQALNDTRLILIDRMGPRRPRGTTAARLRLYFAAQDVHERVSSSHYPYDALAEAFFHSDVLFRCERLLRLDARLCRQRADALRMRSSWVDDGQSRAALNDVASSIEGLRRQDCPAPLMRSLDALLLNMQAIQALLEHESPAAPPGEELTLQDPDPQTLREAWSRIRIQFTVHSFRFRHAVRLSLALLAGYGVLHLVHPRQGYWILLTTLLVCQPSYGATRLRLLQRIGGTLLGLFAGWATLRLVPFGPLQAALLIVAGVVFFALRQRRYVMATAAITLFVVLCFDQVGKGYEVMWPRLLDTLIGVGIAALAIHWVLPDWQGRRLGQVLADTCRCNARYLAQILAQYASGKRDDLAYRIARRDAHNADATLSGVLSNVLREPGHARQGTEVLLRFLGLSHQLLGQLSALGAHRQAVAAQGGGDAIARQGDAVAAQLEQIAEALGGHVAITDSLPPPEPSIPESADEMAAWVLGQLQMVRTQAERLAQLARKLPVE